MIIVQEKISTTKMNEKLLHVAKAAGIWFEGSQFTTHCFRRGGAQYRFLHAKRKMTLDQLRRWGGWSRGEKPGTIAMYLLNEVLREEDSVENILDPDHMHNDLSIFDEVNNFHQFRDDVVKSIETLQNGINQVIQKLSQTPTAAANLPANPPLLQAPVELHQPAATPPAGPTYLTPVLTNARVTIAIPPTRGWRQILQAWNEGIGGHKPLKSWTEEERSNQRAAYSQKKRIVDEYNELVQNGDETPFFAKYPAAEDDKFSQRALYKLIVEGTPQRKNNPKRHKNN